MIYIEKLSSTYIYIYYIFYAIHINYKLVK